MESDKERRAERQLLFPPEDVIRNAKALTTNNNTVNWCIKATANLHSCTPPPKQAVHAPKKSCKSHLARGDPKNEVHPAFQGEMMYYSNCQVHKEFLVSARC